MSYAPTQMNNGTGTNSTSNNNNNGGVLLRPPFTLPPGPRTKDDLSPAELKELRIILRTALCTSAPYRLPDVVVAEDAEPLLDHYLGALLSPCLPSLEGRLRKFGSSDFMDVSRAMGGFTHFAQMDRST